MRLLRRLYARLRLTVSATRRLILPPAAAQKLQPRKLAPEYAGDRALGLELTRRSCGHGLNEVVKQMRVYVLGWKA